MGQRIVVVGASLGGLRAAEAVRAAGFTGEVVVLGDEPHMPYTRPPLSKEALRDGVSHADLEFHRRASVHDVGWLLGHRAVSSSFADQTVSVRGPDGDRLVGWDGLVVATGVRPRRLATDAPPAGRHAVRTLEDAHNLRAELGPGRRVVVLGAGFVGCEVAATAVTLGARVDVVAPEAVPLLRALGHQPGAELLRRHEARGVRFHLGRLPALVEGDDAGSRVAAVVLDDGTRLVADVVVEALGCVPNIEWLDGAAGLDLSDGVLCDGWMRASTAAGPRGDVVAVGDVARYPNALYDDVARRVEHWNMPTETARRAGPSLVAGLAGGDRALAPFAALPTFWSDQYDLRLQSFGDLGLADEIAVLEGDLGGEAVVGYRRDGHLVGVLGLVEPATAGTWAMRSLLGLRGELSRRS